MKMQYSKYSYTLFVCLLLLSLLATGAIDDRVLKRKDAKKWKRVAEVSRIKARSGARQYLEDSSSVCASSKLSTGSTSSAAAGPNQAPYLLSNPDPLSMQELVVPIEVDIILVGFNRDGGYGYKLSGDRLLNLLSTRLQWYCPFSWETEEELGVCMHVNFQVVSGDQDPEVSTLLRKLEAHLKANMKQSHAIYDEAMVDGQRRYYTVEASEVEPIFNEFMEHLYEGQLDGADAAQSQDQGLGGTTGTGSVIVGGTRKGPKGRADVWHRHNAIFVLNPSKVRMNPADTANANAAHIPPDFIKLWQEGTYDDAQLSNEEAGYIYRYQYNGAGETAIWHSSKNYLVLDLSAGPSTYGPLVSQSGAVTPQALPSIKDTYRELLDQLRDTPNQQTVREYAQQTANSGLVTLLAGKLAAVLAAGVKAAFIPDMATQHIEVAKTVLVPLVVLSDHPISPDEAAAQSQENYFGINVTHVEAALAHLLTEGQEGVVITTWHELHQHKQLAAVLHKATRSHSEAVVDMPDGSDYKGNDMGIHVNSNTYIDPEVLLQEIELSADMLTHGLVTVAHTMGKENAHHIAQLRHAGTRVVPVFVLSLENHPEDVVLSNRELMAADHDSIVVLQIRHGSKWGGPDEFFTGHMANGRRVVLDGAKCTRHVVAGLAQALAGVTAPYRTMWRVTPPYQQFEPALNRLENDWRWAAGATPFGPYSNYDGISEIMQNAARRNELLAHVGAALRQLQQQLDALDAFVTHHFQGPWEAAGMKDSNRHWLDTVASTRHGYNTTLSRDVVYHLESALSNISTMVEDLAMDMFTHDFKAADAVVADRLLPAVADLCTQLDHHLDAAEEVMQCCRMGSVNLISQAVLTIMACAGGAAVFFTLVGVALCARLARRKAVKSIGLPTYGLPMYSGKSGTWSL